MFQIFLYEKQFKIITDHSTLHSILKEHGCNKSYNSRLTRWVERLLIFQYEIEHLPGAKIGLLNFIFRHPNQKAKKISALMRNLWRLKLNLFPHLLVP